ncbi:MAG: hypothetical protein HS126_23025 [Anaerolineales bacterium]|nr:hypothetical protein [Anaerolineales bacterium]
MQIKILNIISNQDSENYVVDFATEFGSGRGEWNGDPPVISHSYEVEFEIKEDLVWGESIVQVEHEQIPPIKYQDNVLTLYGKLEAVYPDGGADIRIGHSILMVVTVGSLPEINSSVQIRSKRTIIFPYDKDDILPETYDHQQSVKVFTPKSYREYLNRFGQTIEEYARLYELDLKHKTREHKLSDQEQLRRIAWRAGISLAELKRSNRPELEKMDKVQYQQSLLRQEYFHRLPVHLLAQCPYCGTHILQPVDTFSLMGFYPLLNVTELYRGPGWVSDPPFWQHCRHFVVVTFSVNLNNLTPDDLPFWALRRKWLKMDSAPRVMVWPLIAGQTSAVIHALPVGRLDEPELLHSYTIYFITYFADDQTNLYSEEMWVPADFRRPATDGVYYDLDLIKWLEAGRLFWLNPDKFERTLMRGPVEVFPYANIQPQGWYEIIEDGRIDGPKSYHATWQGPALPPEQSYPKTVE